MFVIAQKDLQDQIVLKKPVQVIVMGMENVKMEFANATKILSKKIAQRKVANLIAITMEFVSKECVSAKEGPKEFTAIICLALIIAGEMVDVLVEKNASVKLVSKAMIVRLEIANSIVVAMENVQTLHVLVIKDISENTVRQEAAKTNAIIEDTVSMENANALCFSKGKHAT